MFIRPTLHELLINQNADENKAKAVAFLAAEIVEMVPGFRSQLNGVLEYIDYLNRLEEIEAKEHLDYEKEKAFWQGHTGR